MDATVIKKPWSDWAAKNFPEGATPRKMKITRCSFRHDKDAWYKNMIGETVDIHYFATFGAWDTHGRWIDYYDLTFDLNYKPTLNGDKWWEVLNLIPDATESDIKRAYRVKSHIFHPDKKPFGNAADFRKLKNAYEQALKYVVV